MRKNYSPIINHFTTKRGEPTFILILCGKCQNQLLVYQKDGLGLLKRCYLDRIHESTLKIKEESSLITCPYCMRKLGYLDPYEKEKRWAIYWFVDCVQTQV
ncbi:MAG: hypothetical protein AAGI90_06130 [Chlamydiota bacterium]